MVQRGGDWAGPQPAQVLAVPNVTAHSSTASVPITVVLYNGSLLGGFNVPIKGQMLCTDVHYYNVYNEPVYHSVRQTLWHHASLSHRHKSGALRDGAVYLSVRLFVRLLPATRNTAGSGELSHRLH